MLTDRTLHMRSALGVLLLSGIVEKNGIWQVDFTNVLRRRALWVRGDHRRQPRAAATTEMVVIRIGRSGRIRAASSKDPGLAQNTSIAISVFGGQDF